MFTYYIFFAFIKSFYIKKHSHFNIQFIIYYYNHLNFFLFLFSIIVIFFSFIFKLERYEYAVLFLTFGSVMMAELFNTALEALVNLSTSSYAELARITKDVAAAAVLISAVASVGIGLALFLKFEKLMATLLLIGTTPVYLISFIFLILFGILFIFKGFSLFKFKSRGK